MRRAKATSYRLPRARRRRGRSRDAPGTSVPADTEDGCETRAVLLEEVHGLRRRVAELLREREELERRSRALGERDERHRERALHAPDLVAEVGAHGIVLYLSPNCVDLLGRPPDAFLGRSIADPAVMERVHPEDRLRIFEDLPGWASDERPGASVFRWLHPNGRIRRFEARANPFRTRTGEFRTVVSCRDVGDDSVEPRGRRPPD